MIDVQLTNMDMIRRMGGVFQKLENSVANKLINEGKAKKIKDDEDEFDEIGVIEENTDDNKEKELTGPCPDKGEPIFDIDKDK